MNANQFYANGRVAVLSNKLFGADKFARLAECGSLAEALKVLAESGYGSASSNAASDYETMLNSELDSAVGVFKELCLDKATVKYFLCKYDYLNAKILMKSKYLRVDGTGKCFNCAEYPPQKMQQDFVSDDYSAVSCKMAEACDAIDTDFANGKRSSQLIDFHLDKAMYAEMNEYAKKSSFKPLRELIRFTIDAINLMSVYRLKKAEADFSDLEKWYLPSGKIELKTLEKIWENEQSVSDLSAEYKEFYELCKSDRITLEEAENAVKRKLTSVLGDNADLLTVQPVLDYFVRKTDEIDTVRRILSAVKSGTDKEKIKELLK